MWPVILGGALVGGFISGLAGFGTALLALGIWLHAVPPAIAATLVVMCSVTAQVQTLPAVWHAVDRARVLPFVLPGLVGVPIGTVLLGLVDPAMFRAGVGVLLVSYAAFMLLVSPRLRITWGGRLADAAVGLGGGVLGGLAGLSGPLPTVWASLRGWGKDERRAVFQVFNLTVLALALLVHLLAGHVTQEVLWLALLALPGTIFGARLGIAAYRRLSDRRFNDVVLALLAASGLSLLWAAL